jgi:hypothetical protein
LELLTIEEEVPLEDRKHQYFIPKNPIYRLSKWFSGDSTGREIKKG